MDYHEAHRPKTVEAMVRHILPGQWDFPQQQELDDLSQQLARLTQAKEQFDRDHHADQLQAINEYFLSKCGRDVETIVADYITHVDRLAQQAGIGHGWTYTQAPDRCRRRWSPDHWMIAPEQYDLAKPSPDQLLALQCYQANNPSFMCCLRTDCRLHQFMS